MDQVQDIIDKAVEFDALTVDQAIEFIKYMEAL